MNTSERNMIKELVAISSLVKAIYNKSDFTKADKENINKLSDKSDFIYRNTAHLSTGEFSSYQSLVEKDWKKYESHRRLLKKELDIK